jgi:hypothetical protein
MQIEQPIRDLNSVIGVDADQVGVESRVMELGQRQSVRDDRLPKLLVCIHDDVRGIEQLGFGQMRDPAMPWRASIEGEFPVRKLDIFYGSQTWVLVNDMSGIMYQTHLVPHPGMGRSRP